MTAATAQAPQKSAQGRKDAYLGYPCDQTHNWSSSGPHIAPGSHTHLRTGGSDLRTAPPEPQSGLDRMKAMARKENRAANFDHHVSGQSKKPTVGRKFCPEVDARRMAIWIKRLTGMTAGQIAADMDLGVGLVSHDIWIMQHKTAAAWIKAIPFRRWVKP